MRTLTLLVMASVFGGCAATDHRLSVIDPQPLLAELEAPDADLDDELGTCIAALLPLEVEDSGAPSLRDAFKLSLQEETPQVEVRAEAPDPEWVFSAGLFVWVPGVDGHVTLKGVRADVDLSVTEFVNAVVDNFSFAAMTLFELRHDDVFFDLSLMYLGLKVDEQIDTPITSVDIDLKTDMVIATGWLGYRFLDVPLGEDGTAPRLALSGLLGATLWHVRLEFDGPLQDRDASQTWLDPSVGLRADLSFSKDLALQVQGYVGGFGLGSHFAWGFRAQLMWQASDSFALSAGWLIKSSDYDTGSGLNRFEWDIELSGPGLSGVFTF